LVDGKPQQPRSGPYVNVTKMSFPKRTVEKNKVAFVIPAAIGTRRTLSSLCFLDSFSQAILYYKANPSASAVAAAGSWTMSSSGNEFYSQTSNHQYLPAGIYNQRDNYQLTGCRWDTNGGMDFGAGVGHPMRLMSQNDPYNPSTIEPVASTFDHAIWNPNVTATRRPHNEDSYILLSAGPDGLYGTADDIANFPVNK
jgi:hypothetical protein